jgi:hypothetical protein
MRLCEFLLQVGSNSDLVYRVEKASGCEHTQAASKKYMGIKLMKNNNTATAISDSVTVDKHNHISWIHVFGLSCIFAQSSTNQDFISLRKGFAFWR